jgi:Response regulators consisting of a CheY-like receiver domain and a winged-helix DNA-binding domain
MPKILVVDDDKDFQDTTRIVLEKNGFQVAAAYDAEEGLEKVQSEEPDLVILDVMMPSGYEGFEVARKIREELKLVELPVVLLTAVHDVKKVPYRFAPHDQWLPVDYFYDKPVAPDVLVAK